MSEQLTGRALAAEIARRVMGWRELIGQAWQDSRGWVDRDGKVHELPYFSTSLAACREAELVMEGRGLADVYAICLAQALSLCQSGPMTVEMCVRRVVYEADAETRCRAMLAALGE